jgi:hypothetical protein
LEKKYDDLGGGAINELNQLKKRKMLAGRVGGADYNSQAKEKNTQLMKKEKSIRTNNNKISPPGVSISPNRGVAQGKAGLIEPTPADRRSFPPK